MNDSLLMGVLHGPADLHEQVQASGDRQAMLIAIVRELYSAHEFHHEVGSAAVRRAGVNHLGDVGMIHHCQGLPFGLKPRHHRPSVHAQLDDLQRHPPPDRLLLFGDIHHATSAFTDLLAKFVVADRRAELLRRRVDANGGARRRCTRLRARCLEEFTGGHVITQHGFDALAQAGVLTAGPRQVGGTLLR